MPRFADAVGYLLELRDSVAETWFHALCDYAIASTGQQPHPDQLESLYSFFHRLAGYTAAAAAVRPSQASGSNAPAYVYLESLSDFDAFKKLVPGLTIRFDRQLTVVFGKNGSGKSSVCQALKVLGNAERPSDPLHNVRATYPGTPSFSYRFRGDLSPATWTPASGFGAHTAKIKYFDSTVALRYTSGSLHPRAVVEITAFRLEVFEYAGQYLTAFQAAATSRVDQAATRLQLDIDAVKQRLAHRVDIHTPPFAEWGAVNSETLSTYLAQVPAFDEAKQARLDECERAAVQLAAASSEDGVRGLRAQHTLLDQLASQLTTLGSWCNSARLAELQAAEVLASQKSAARTELALHAFPSGVNPSLHQSLISAAAAMYDLGAFRAGQHVCPLCNQAMSINAQRLFAAYHSYLTSTIQSELSALDGTLQNGRSILQRIESFQLGDYSVCRESLPEGMYDGIRSLVEAIVGAVPGVGQPLSRGDPTQYSRAAELGAFVAAIRSAQGQLSQAIAAGSQSYEAVTGRIKSVQKEIGDLYALQAIAEERDVLRALCDRAKVLTPEYQRVSKYDFAARLRALTNKGKEAHRELVLASLEQRLSDEYRGLCGATLDQMGVRLASRGEQQDIIVTPHVGEAPVSRVLSEGEQKVHALAVFMCEATNAPHRVLVFDDPATSFDYNYVSNFCERLRNLVRDQPNTQVIVLTHNWDFFVGLQTTVNRSPGLNARMSVQVLEDCATVREYAERWDEISNELAPLLAGPGEPSADEKARIAGLMRRLIECLTNKHVFNDQRHQYKQKTVHVSEFHAFTKVVPLEVAEADALRDIYANLSPSEHDDVRNYYTSRSRGQFNTWLSQIGVIKAALEARRP